MSSDPGASQDRYILGRDLSAAHRYVAQHFLWKNQWGWNTHPTITKSLASDAVNLKLTIADVACGNGLWMTDEYNSLGINTRFVGFDNSSAQFPPADTIPARISFEVWDFFSPVADQFHEVFDLVHIRLVSAAILDRDPLVVLRNVLTILKPGGFLQWDEVTVKNETLKSSAAAEGEWLAACAPRLMQKYRPEYTFPEEWTASLADLFQQVQLNDITYLCTKEPPIGMWQPWTDNNLGAINEFGKFLGAEAEVEQELAKCRRNGVQLFYTIQVVVGRKGDTTSNTKEYAP